MFIIWGWFRVDHYLGIEVEIDEIVETKEGREHCTKTSWGPASNDDGSQVFMTVLLKQELPETLVYRITRDNQLEYVEDISDLDEFETENCRVICHNFSLYYIIPSEGLLRVPPQK